MSKKTKKSGFAQNVEAQLAVSNPITQHKILMENIDSLKSNIKETLKLILPFSQNLNPNEAPCEMAKFVANKVCSLQINPSDMTNMFSLTKMKDLLSQAQDQVEGLTSDLQLNNLGADMSGRLSELVDTTSSLSKETGKNVQKGGGKQEYKYIINPRTNRRVRSDSKLGKQIILEYISNL